MNVELNEAGPEDAWLVDAWLVDAWFGEAALTGAGPEAGRRGNGGLGTTPVGAAE